MTTVLAGLNGSAPSEVLTCDPFAWAELAACWNAGDFREVHDWLGLRWNYLIQTRPGGHEDKDARFLQALAFAALAFHFTQNQKQEGAALVADDALSMLPAYLPSYRGLDVAPVIASLSALRPLLEGLAPEDDCPMRPFTFKRLSYTSTGP